MSTSPLIYIIVLNWNGLADTLACLTSLQQLTTPQQTIVIDNGSSDDSVYGIREAFPHIPVLTLNKNVGFAAGNNVGICYALNNGADYLLILNNDTLVTPNFLQPLVAALDQDPHIAAVNPKIYYLNQPNTIWAAGGQISRWSLRCDNRGKGMLDRGQFEQQTAVSFGTGCCLLIRSTALAQIGLFHDAYFAYFEDVDWALRAQAAGFAIHYVPNSHIWHAVGASSKRSGNIHQEGTVDPFIYFLGARNYLWLLRTHFSFIQFIIASAIFCIRHMLYYSIGFIIRQRRQKLCQLWAGFRAGFLDYADSYRRAPPPNCPYWPKDIS